MLAYFGLQDVACRSPYQTLFYELDIKCMIEGQFMFLARFQIGSKLSHVVQQGPNTPIANYCAHTFNRNNSVDHQINCQPMLEHVQMFTFHILFLLDSYPELIIQMKLWDLLNVKFAASC